MKPLLGGGGERKKKKNSKKDPKNTMYENPGGTRPLLPTPM